MEYHAHLLRSIGDQMKLPPLDQIAHQPGISAAYRLTVRYHDRRAVDSVATLRRWRDRAALEIVYLGLFDHRPLALPIEPARVEALTLALGQLRFDRLKDQPELPPYGVDLWLLERSAAGFYRGVILAPPLAQGVYAGLAAAVRAHLPEALREVRL